LAGTPVGHGLTGVDSPLLVDLAVTVAVVEMARLHGRRELLLDVSLIPYRREILYGMSLDVPIR
jgi:hypothetical protein